MVNEYIPPCVNEFTDETYAAIKDAVAETHDFEAAGYSPQTYYDLIKDMIPMEQTLLRDRYVLGITSDRELANVWNTRWHVTEFNRRVIAAKHKRILDILYKGTGAPDPYIVNINPACARLFSKDLAKILYKKGIYRLWDVTNRTGDQIAEMLHSTYLAEVMYQAVLKNGFQWDKYDSEHLEIADEMKDFSKEAKEVIYAGEKVYCHSNYGNLLRKMKSIQAHCAKIIASIESSMARDRERNKD
jgi:hypothetical protein